MRREKRNISYKADLLADLRNDPRFAAEYLSAAYADSRGAFLVALRDVVEATKGIGKVATLAKVDRVHLYRSLSEAGNPTLSTLNSIWNVLGFDVEFKPRVVKPKAPAALIAAVELAGNPFASTTIAIEFSNIATSRSDLTISNPVSTTGEPGAFTSAGGFLPGFIAHATGASQQPNINAFGD